MHLRNYINILVLIISFILPFSAFGTSHPFTIVIDAGHGGHDTGAAENGTREKDINLGVALALGKMIETEMKGVKVVYTRKDDTFKALQKRADIANSAKGDLFISIHTNSVDKKNPNRSNVAGASVYALGLHKDANNMNVARRENSVIELEKDYKQTYQGFDPDKDESYIIFEMAQKKNLSKSILFAKDVQKQLVSIAGRKDRGVHQAGFWVLWATSMPAVLIELDFICNPTSARFMTSSNGKEKLARSIFNAVANYVKREGTGPAPSNVSEEPRKKSNSGSGVHSRSRSGRKSSGRKKTASAEKIEAPAPETPAVVKENVPVLASSQPEVQKSHIYQNPSRHYAVGQRRRRNDEGRRLSDTKIQSISYLPVSKSYKLEVVEIEPEPATSAPQELATSHKKTNKKVNKKSKGNSRVQHMRKVFSILIMTSDKQLGNTDSCFRGLSPLSSYKESNTYKYVYGDFPTRADAEKELKKVLKNFPEASVIQQYRN